VPVLSAPLAGFALGAGLYWSAARQLARPIRPVAGHAVLIAGVLGVFAYAPAVAFILTAEPDWAYAYLIAAQRLPGWLTPCLVLLSGSAVPLGFGAALRASRGRPAFVQGWFWVPLGLALAPVLIAARRLAVVGTFEQFHGDFGVRSLLGGPLGYLLGYLFVLLFAAAWLARRCLAGLAAGGAEGS
jgi:hypothetical protein